MFVLNQSFTVFIYKSAALTCSRVFVFMLLQIESSCVLYGRRVVSVRMCTHNVTWYLAFSILTVFFAYPLFCAFLGPAFSIAATAI